MIDANSDCRKSQRFTARRLTLLASVAAIGATVLLTGSASYWQSAAGAVPANAAEFGMQRPVGFADIVAKLKPAVISVRVKVSGAAEPALLHDESNDREQQIRFNPARSLIDFSDNSATSSASNSGHVRRSATTPLPEKARASLSQQTAMR